MARRRFGAPHTVSTKGHSILKQRAYGIPSRRPLTDVFVPHTPIPRHHYAAYAEEDSLHRAVGDELRFSSSAVDENYDMAYKSRDRDHQLMTDINQAIVSSEAHSSPKAAVASRRATLQQHVATPHAYVPRHVPRQRFHKEEDGRLPSSRLHAHAPVHYPPSQAKAIRDVQGFTEPHNVMSWKYRLEARTKPGDMLFHSEHAYESMKDRVLDVHDKLDRHRQLLDRYLTPNLGPETEDVSSQVLNKYTELEARDPMGAGSHYTPGSYDAGGHSHHYESHVDASMADAPSAKPVSDLRKRLRRVICKSKRDAGYYH